MEVGHPSEVRPAMRELAKEIALRATGGKAPGLTISRRHHLHPLAVAGESMGVEIWDVWNDARRGGGPPDGVCYGTIVVSRAAWLESGGPIVIEESHAGHLEALAKQARNRT